MVIHSSDRVDIRASDVISESNYFKRKIEIIDRKYNSIYSEFIITLKSNDTKANIYTELKQRSFSGTMTIESENVVLTKFEIVNGSIIESPDNTSSQPIQVSVNLIPTCKVSLIHGCVDQKIRAMNFIEYGLCLYAAPECYGGLWAACSWQFCVTGEQ